MKSSVMTTFVAGITCISLGVASTLLSTPVHAQILTMPTGWIATAGPSGPFKEHSKLMQANYSRHEWRVRVSSGRLEITDNGSRDHEEAGVVFPPHFHRSKDMIGRAMTTRAGDDWLIGFDAGEFGGGLWWTSTDGKRTKLLTRENVQAFVRRGKDVLVFTGLAHLTYDRGAAYLFRSIGDDGEIIRIADLDSAPYAASLENNGSVLIAVSNGVVTLRPDGSAVRLYKQEEMPILYPNSVAGEESDAIYVGMRFYVLRLDRRADGMYESTWFERSSRRHD
jgi:hypothetical protein